jgi:hypothetical protein
MTAPTLTSAHEYVSALSLPAVAFAGTGPVDLALDSARNQAAVVGSEIVSFVSGVPAARREAIVNSSLLAQLVAKDRVPDPRKIYDWYDAYFDVLMNIGWLLQDRSFAQYRESSKNLEAHQAILAVATTLLGAAPTALALVKTTIDSLQSMDKDSPWITLFSRESQFGKAAKFQISVAEQAADGRVLVSLMAFGLEAKTTITRVLFFKAKASEATLRHYAGQVGINVDVLDGVGPDIKRKVIGHAAGYIRGLPHLR